MSEVSRWMPVSACLTASLSDRGGSRSRLPDTCVANATLPTSAASLSPSPPRATVCAPRCVHSLGRAGPAWMPIEEMGQLIARRSGWTRATGQARTSPPRRSRLLASTPRPRPEPQARHAQIANAPVIPPPGRAGDRGSGRMGPVRRLPLAGLPAVPALPGDVLYGLGRIDSSGRIADREVIAVLGWHAGDRLTLTAAGSVVTARRDPDGMIEEKTPECRPPEAVNRGRSALAFLPRRGMPSTAFAAATDGSALSYSVRSAVAVRVRAAQRPAAVPRAGRSRSRRPAGG